MRLIQLVLERLRNPLRRKELERQGITPIFPNKGERKDYEAEWMAHIISSNIGELSPEERIIRKQFNQLLNTAKENSENAAWEYLSQAKEEYFADIAQPKVEMSHHEKIYEIQGVQVFVDRRFVKDDYSKGSYNYRMVKSSVDNMLTYIREILPNRKPRIVITDFDKHPVTRAVNTDWKSAGMYYKKIIYIDQYYIDDHKYFVHEYAHWVADRIPKQTEEMLWGIYEQLITKYYKRKKVKRQPTDFYKGVDLSPEELNKIAQKLGFPSGYGFTNKDEFFAVLIEHWKSMPNNPVTYKYKQMVKQILNRL